MSLAMVFRNKKKVVIYEVMNCQKMLMDIGHVILLSCSVKHK